MKEVKISELISKKLDRKVDTQNLAMKKNRYAIIAFVVASAFWVYTIVADQYQVAGTIIILAAFWASLHYSDKSTKAIYELSGYLDGVTDSILCDVEQSLKSHIEKTCEDCDDKENCEAVIKSVKTKKTSKK